MKYIFKTNPETDVSEANATITIDVRTIAPRERHATVFAAFGNLPEGADLEIVSDHPPEGLHRHFEAEQPGRFSWAYAEEGPPVWRVTLGKPARSHAAGGCCGVCGGV
jgi:uncharacterized protein (DUF2249 family)